MLSLGLPMVGGRSPTLVEVPDHQPRYFELKATSGWSRKTSVGPLAYIGSKTTIGSNSSLKTEVGSNKTMAQPICSNKMIARERIFYCVLSRTRARARACMCVRVCGAPVRACTRR